MKGLRITNKENDKWMVQESPTIFYSQTIDDYYVDSVNILTDQELQERDERIAREAFKAGQINGIRIGFENAKESEWRKEEGGEYLRDKYESVEDLLKEVE